MTQNPYILFNKSPEQLRLLGAQGGRAYGRNRRLARRALPPTPPKVLSPHVLPGETVAKAIHLLDTQFPWLCGAERQPSPSSKVKWTPSRNEAELPLLIPRRRQ
jgi:hypothetical protein